MDVGGTCFAVLIAGKEDEVHIPIAHTCQYVNGGTGRLVEKKFCLLFFLVALLILVFCLMIFLL